MIKADSTFIKTFLFIILFVTVILVLGRNINPFINEMFTFHDETQAARIEEFTLNLQQLQIPPRIATHFSFGLGYPMFNYYAPFSYWVTSGFDLVGFDIIASLKLSIVLAIITAFAGMFTLMKQYISYYGSLLSAVVYSVSPYIAVEIFVRGNMAELWFYAIFPWTLYLLKTNTAKRLLLTSVVLSFLFTSHNILSLVSVPLVIFFGLLQEKKKHNLFSVVAGLLLSSYFLLPAIAELNLVHASNVATITNYAEHFLCLNQLWTGPWGFAGSAPGCDADGMSFMLGKANILLGLFGLFCCLYYLNKKKLLKKSYDVIFIAILMLGSVFFVTSASSTIWQLTESISSMFQFPWRLVIFVLFSISFFSGFITTILPKKLVVIIIVILSIGVLYTNHEYFYGNTISNNEYNSRFLSEEYIKNEVAYKVAEYLPTSADYNYWRSFEENPELVDSNYILVDKPNQEFMELRNDDFYKQVSARAKDSKTTLNIHYAPYWKIRVNEQLVIPKSFDKLGRPILTISDTYFDEITVTFQQTYMQQLANNLSLISLLSLTLYTVTQFKPLWKHSTTKKH